ncbi:MAG: helix-turn-helix domain-containing protein [Phycisphaeraceae bacterium]|nr:helix-turn-helix domain-containing protein [Phycisphaeraceae bacterium]
MGISKIKQNDWVPYTMSLPDGCTLFVRIPGHYVEYDRGGEMMFTPQGARFLDNIRAMAIHTPDTPSPAYIKQVREAMKLTQADLAKKLDYSLISVKKWEAGDARPGKKAVDRLRKLVDTVTKRGLVLAS